MDAASFLQALAMAQTAHTGGHFVEANEQGVPMRLNALNFTEEWGQPYRRPYDFKADPDTGRVYAERHPGYLNEGNESRIHGAGFAMQDKIGSAMDSEEMYAANALIKALYMAGLPKLLSKDIRGYGGGDIENMDRINGGGRRATNALAASLGSDVVNALYPESPVSVEFDTDSGGAPRAMAWYRKRF